MKAFFLGRNLREKLLLLLLAAAVAALWLMAASGRVTESWRAWRSMSVTLEDQRIWLGNRSAIEARAARAAQNLDPDQTLDATHLVSEVVALAELADLSPSVDPPRTQRAGQFAYHTVQVTFRRAELEALVRFYREFGRRVPYLALERCSLLADRANPAQLNATFVIFSVEVNAAQGDEVAILRSESAKSGSR